MPYVLSHKINCAAGFNNSQGAHFPCTCALYERQTIERLQAKIDALMLEYCPDEMTEEQMANWARHQQLVSAKEQAKIEAALTTQNAEPEINMAPYQKRVVTEKTELDKNFSTNLPLPTCDHCIHNRDGICGNFRAEYEGFSGKFWNMRTDVARTEIEFCKPQGIHFLDRRQSSPSDRRLSNNLTTRN